MAHVKERRPALPYRTTADLESQLDQVRAAPADAGAVRLVVRRPGLGVREILEEGRLEPAEGLVGDTWLARARPRAIADGRHFDAQVNVMSARMVALLADTAEEQAYAGDQLFLDLDLSHANLPTGSQLAFGEPGSGGAVIEVSAKPHNGCAKFVARYGEDAMRFVNSPAGKELRLRGFNARIVEAGVIRPGDVVRVVRRGGLDDQTDPSARSALAV
jgi:MOSC domain-containing protein YiiM